MRFPIPRLAVTTLAIMIAGISQTVSARDFQYDCQNDPVRIAIPASRLPDALGELRVVTRCPISGTRLARGKRSQAVVGAMAPEQALRQMLVGTGLEVRPIRNGFQIVPIRR